MSSNLEFAIIPTPARLVRRGQTVISPGDDSRAYRVRKVETRTIAFQSKTTLVLAGHHDNGKAYQRTVVLFADELVDVEGD